MSAATRAEPGNVASVRAIMCRACGKLHRVRKLARDSSGHIALHFRFTCIRCGLCEAVSLHEIIIMPPDRGNPHTAGMAADQGAEAQGPETSAGSPEAESPSALHRLHESDSGRAN